MYLLQLFCLALLLSIVNSWKSDTNVIKDTVKTDELVSVAAILRNIVISKEHDVQQDDRLDVGGGSNGCACVNYNCGCCQHIKVKDLVDNTFCANVTYLTSDYGIRVTVNYGSFVLLNDTVSARNPPPICAGIPELKKEASICIKFHDLELTNSTFKGCVALQLLIVKIFHEEYELGCFTIPPQDSDKSVLQDGNEFPSKYDISMAHKEPAVRLQNVLQGNQTP